MGLFTKFLKEQAPKRVPPIPRKKEAPAKEEFRFKFAYLNEYGIWNETKSFYKSEEDFKRVHSFQPIAVVKLDWSVTKFPVIKVKPKTTNVYDEDYFEEDYYGDDSPLF